MSIETQKFIRTPFEVEAVRVTVANMVGVAEWCNGTIVEEGQRRPHIQVDVKKPLSERQTKAFIGDWVLYASKGFKVYSSKAFEASFQLADETVIIHEEEDPKPVESAETRQDEKTQADLELEALMNELNDGKGI